MRSVNLLQEAADNHTDEAALAAFKDVGQLLAEARTEQNLSIKQVAAKIHIRQRYLIDLEEGNLSDLPGRVYIFGFIRNYARLLGLDGEELIRRINAIPSLSTYEHGHAPTPMPSEEEPSYLILGISAVIVIVLSFGGYLYLKPIIKQPSQAVEVESKKESESPTIVKQEINETSSDTHKQEPLPLGQPSQSSNTAVLRPAPKTAEPNSQEKPQGTIIQSDDKKESTLVSKQVILKATEPAWVEVRDDTNRILYMRVMKRGDEYVVPSKPGITFSTGNAGGMKIFVGDTELPTLGGRGEVKRGILIETLQK